MNIDMKKNGSRMTGHIGMNVHVVKRKMQQIIHLYGSSIKRQQAIQSESSMKNVRSADLRNRTIAEVQRQGIIVIRQFGSDCLLFPDSDYLQ